MLLFEKCMRKVKIYSESRCLDKISLSGPHEPVSKTGALSIVYVNIGMIMFILKGFTHRLLAKETLFY